MALTFRGRAATVLLVLAVSRLLASVSAEPPSTPMPTPMPESSVISNEELEVEIEYGQSAMLKLRDWEHGTPESEEETSTTIDLVTTENSQSTSDRGTPPAKRSIVKRFACDTDWQQLSCAMAESGMAIMGPEFITVSSPPEFIQNAEGFVDETISRFTATCLNFELTVTTAVIDDSAIQPDWAETALVRQTVNIDAPEGFSGHFYLLSSMRAPFCLECERTRRRNGSCYFAAFDCESQSTIVWNEAEELLTAQRVRSCDGGRLYFDINGGHFDTIQLPDVPAVSNGAPIQANQAVLGLVFSGEQLAEGTRTVEFDFLLQDNIATTEHSGQNNVVTIPVLPVSIVGEEDDDAHCDYLDSIELELTITKHCRANQQPPAIVAGDFEETELFVVELCNRNTPILSAEVVVDLVGPEDSELAALDVPNGTFTSETKTWSVPALDKDDCVTLTINVSVGASAPDGSVFSLLAQVQSVEPTPAVAPFLLPCQQYDFPQPTTAVCPVHRRVCLEVDVECDEPIYFDRTARFATNAVPITDLAPKEVSTSDSYSVSSYSSSSSDTSRLVFGKNDFFAVLNCSVTVVNRGSSDSGRVVVDINTRLPVLSRVASIALTDCSLLDDTDTPRFSFVEADAPTCGAIVGTGQRATWIVGPMWADQSATAVVTVVTRGDRTDKVHVEAEVVSSLTRETIDCDPVIFA